MQGNIFYFGWEVAFMEWLQTALGEIGSYIAVFFTYCGQEMVLIALGGLIYWGLNKELGKKIAVSLCATLIWSSMIKNVFCRRRPYFDHKNITCLMPPESGDKYSVAIQGYSFPSMHSSSTVAFYGTAALSTKKGWVIGAVSALCFFIGLSRIVLGVHYPTDVLAGWAVGALVVTMIELLWDKVNRYALMGVLFLTAIPGLFYCTSQDYFTVLGLMAGLFTAIWFEEKYVRFSSTKSPLQIVLRILGGFIIYLGLNVLLKLPFPEEFLEADIFESHIVRTFRYAIIAFVDFGLYPLTFQYMEKLFKKQSA